MLNQIFVLLNEFRIDSDCVLYEELVTVTFICSSTNQSHLGRNKIDRLISHSWTIPFLPHSQDAEAAAREDVQQVLDLMAEYRRRWDSTWDEQERRLRQNLQICQFHFDLRQVI